MLKRPLQRKALPTVPCGCGVQVIEANHIRLGKMFFDTHTPAYRLVRWRGVLRAAPIVHGYVGHTCEQKTKRGPDAQA